MSILVAFLLLLATAATWLWLLAFAKLRGGRGDGPRHYPVLGCLLAFYENKHRLLDWYTELLADSTSRTIVLSRLGATRVVVTANPDNVEHMLRTNFHNYPKGPQLTALVGDLLGHGIFNADGELWHSQRKIASYQFTSRSIREMTTVVARSEVEERLLPLLSAARDRGAVVDMQDLLRRLAFDAISRIALGVDPGCLEPSLPESPFAAAFDVAGAICARRGAAVVSATWRLKRALGVGSERVLREKVAVIRGSVEELIRARKARDGPDGGGDLLSRLAAAGHGEEAVRDMVISFVLAGRDTTSAALTWLFWVLSRHPSVEEEVVREVARLPAGEYAAMQEMRFLEACILETMRLYPPVAWDSKHAASRDTLPDGTVVEAGDRVTYFPYGMGRMEALWGKTAAEFDPRRWLDKDGELVKASPFKYPVFQAGPRICLGREMAFAQMKYVAAAVLRRFELRPVADEAPAFVPLLTAHMAGGLRVTVRERGTVG